MRTSTSRRFSGACSTFSMVSGWCGSWKTAAFMVPSIPYGANASLGEGERKGQRKDTNGPAGVKDTKTLSLRVPHRPAGRPAVNETGPHRHGRSMFRRRPGAGHPRLVMREQRKTWMAGPSPAMTTGASRAANAKPGLRHFHRDARACPGHRRGTLPLRMTGTRPAMTVRLGLYRAGRPKGRCEPAMTV